MSNRTHASPALIPALAAIALAAGASHAGAQETLSYEILATNKTSTMQEEMQQAGARGLRFVSVMGGDTSFGGKEVVVLMQKAPAPGSRFEYRLLATTKTSTMQKELQDAADAGFQYVGQTVFESMFRGNEVAIILERDPSAASIAHDYRLLATRRTSTMQKELQELSAEGFTAVGMTVGETVTGGNEVVVITRRLRSWTPSR